MNFFRKLVRGLASLLLIFLLFSTASTTALIMTFNSPKKVEQSLNDSGVYSTFITGALTEAQKSKDSKSGNDDLPVDNPAIVAAANKAFPPQLLQTTTENVLDGTYDWLTSKTQTPDFTIDFTEAKKTFATEVGKAASARLKTLPVCTAKQLKAMGTNGDIDAFKVTCVPAGLNIKAQQKKITNDLATSKDFLGTTKITPQNMPKDSDGKTLFDKLKEAPNAYKWVNASPWLMIGLTVLVGIITWLLYKDKRRGTRNIAITLIVVGGLLALSYIGTLQAYNKLSQPNGVLGEAVKGSFQQTTIKALSSIIHSVEQVILVFGLVYLITGIITLILIKFLWKKPKTNTTESEKTTSQNVKQNSEKEEKPQTPKPSTKPPTKPTPKRIQG